MQNELLYFLVKISCDFLEATLFYLKKTHKQCFIFFIEIKHICIDIWWYSKTRPGADCGSDHKLLIAKFRLQLKKVGKVTRPFRYDLNQILYDYSVGVMNRFKELNLVGRVPEELWMEVCNIVQEAMTKTIPKKKKWGDLTNSWKKKRSEKQRRKGKIYPTECRIQENSKER